MTLQIPDGPEFHRLASGDDQADLAKIALEIARDANPLLEFAPYFQKIAHLADRVRPRIVDGGTTLDRIRQINWVLFVEDGYSGNDSEYFDPRNSYLDEVIDRRTGIPISLCILYRAVAERVGQPLNGVNLPAHFVLRADCEDGSSIFVDPFHNGRILDRDGCQRLISSRSGTAVELTDEHFLPISTAVIVSRMLRNLRAIHLQTGDAVLAWPVLARLSALNPSDPTLHRDLGVVALGLDQLREGIEQLSSYLESSEQPSDAPVIRDLILNARQRLTDADDTDPG